MTTYIIFPDTDDVSMASVHADYNTAVNGGGQFILDNNQVWLKAGQNRDGSGQYWIHQSFITFDTSVIADTEEVVETSISAYIGWYAGQSVPWGQQWRKFDYTVPVTTAQWQTPALAATRPIYANFDNLFTATPFQWRVTGRDTLTSISKTAKTRFLITSNRFVDGYRNDGVEEIQIDSTRGSNKPYLTVWTVAPSTLNTVTEASTTLPDGTTVSIRSNGGATNPGTPTLTIGYNTLTSSTWTSIGTVHTDFVKTVDGNNSVEIVSDDDGNFYVIGMKNVANNGGVLMGQAYKKTGATTWVAQTPLSQALARGNEQTIRSIAAVWNPAGQDSTDKPGIYGVAVRGSGGNRPEYPYHTSGAGYAHDWTMDPVALLAGSGTLLKMSAVGYGWITEVGLPVSCDLVRLAPNSFAAYTQRGKLGNTVVGGIQMMGMYQGFGLVNETDRNYVSTGVSELVAVSPDVFAQVFDSEGMKLVVRFYNKRAQIIGEASITKDVFAGGVIGTQFASYYDKTANLVRVLYFPTAGTRQVDCFSVSPVTFLGTTTTALTTALGAAGSTNTNLRVSRTADERRVLVEAANVSGSTLSTQSLYVTIGNVAPSAPALTARPNFDATLPATFTWTFGDANSKDYQTGFDIEISRVSDSVVVHAPAKVVSTVSSYTAPASAVSNGVNYRWRVRTYDVIGTAGTWSGYGTFATAATGNLNITSPSTDNASGIETSTVPITWNYYQSSGATQAQRQVKITRTSDNVVVADTGMQASTANTYNAVGLESGKEYRVDVTVINTASIQTPTMSRLVTSNYSQPMTPELQISQKESYIELIVINPTPTGDRPEVSSNDIYRRRTSTNASLADFIRIATVPNSATYHDYAVKSGVSYDYYVVGVTN